MSLRILTPDITQKILDMSEKIDRYVEISIQGDKIFFRIGTGNMFEPSMSDEQTEIENVFIYKTILIDVENIIKEFIKILKEMEI